MEDFHLADEFVDGESERLFLSSLSREPHLYWQCIDDLPPGVFIAEEGLWEAFVDAIESDTALPSLPGDWPEPASEPLELVKKLSDLYQRRLLAETQEKLAHTLYDFGCSADDVVQMLVEEATRVQSAVREVESGRLVWASELLPSILETARERAEHRQLNGRGVTGVTTGFSRLDYLLNGLGTGLYVLAGAPGVGKTTLSLQMALSAIEERVPVVYVTYENSPSNLLLKALCRHAGVSTMEVERGSADLSLLDRAAFEIRDSLRYLALIEGVGALRVEQIRAKALQSMYAHRSERCLIVFDYLQRAAHGKGYTQIRHNVSALAGELRDLSNRLNSPVLAISSQNRTSGAYGRGGSAALDSLKESGDLEYSADAVLFLLSNETRHSFGGGQAMDLVLAKNRFGETGTVSLVFHPERGEMKEEDRL